MRTLLAVSVFLVFLNGALFAGERKILVATWRGCEEACEGFQDHIRENGIDAEFIVHDAARKKDAVPSMLADARAKKVDLIVSWGTSVTLGIAGPMTELENPAYNHDIPQVFMIVADPVGAGIISSLDATGRANLTGTYNRIPEAVNIQTIRSYLPEFKRLGLLYNTDERNSVLKRDELHDLSGKLAFDLIALEIPLNEEGKPRIDQIEPRIAALKAAGADFIYLGSSSFLEKNGDAVTDAAVKNGLPLLSPYERLVRSSRALISVASRYYEVGRLAGQQAEKILKGTPAGDLPVARLTNFAVVINMEVAKELQLFPPIDLLQIAETIN